MGRTSKDLPFNLGLTTFALNPALNNDNLPEFFVDLNRLGIPGNNRSLEIIVHDDPEKLDLGFAKLFGEMAKDNGYRPIVVAFNPQGSPDMVSKDRSEVKRAIERVYGFIEFADAAQAGVISGPWHASHMKREGRDARHLVKPLQKIGERADAHGMLMAVEMLNAFETYLFNYVAITKRILNEVNSKSIGMHWDTAHAIRQEESILGSLDEAYRSGKLYHVHLSEAGRGPLGKGSVSPHIADVMTYLARSGYNKNVIAEIFHPDLWNAVAREGASAIAKMGSKRKYDLAYLEAAESMDFLRHQYRIVKKRV